MPTIYPKPCVMYMEHPFTASEISGSCSHVAQSARLPAVVFFILSSGAGSSANGVFFKTIFIRAEDKNENSRFTACYGHGDGADRLPEYGL
ncbi:MAG TPA: hypothetical protein DFK21_02330 [Salmonella bongori]|uniref:Uncharacterized protein n=2 Tax=Salmonella bongori TaxID=54736 RepID=A0A702BTG1_SALBN|nr:hypothetical protein [Salmonella bongori]HAC6695221.1 hypothetical protein [Salmonella bongori serovar 44:r:-]HAD95604.1 hypothetical protein [Salmonella bongori]HBD17544.1 hypothetical protein [Salmonella bongori]HCI32395.1 hypothetical protein [Salmonella bongori]